MAGTVQKRYDKMPPVEISGSILATDVDRRGKVLEVVLETEDFQQYIIDRDATGKDLCNLLCSTVRVRGSLMGEDEQGRKILKIDRYEVVESLYGGERRETR